MSMHKPVAVIDIDTTIANNDHRAIHLTRVCTNCKIPMQGERGDEKWPVCQCGSTRYHAPQSAWDRFLQPELMLKDEPQPRALDAIRSFREQGWTIVFMTGRNEKHRHVTEEWLRTHMEWDGREPVIMRPMENGGLAASQMKEKMFLEFRERNLLHNHTFFFFEDDRFVHGMYQKYGTVFHCPDAWSHINPAGHDRSVEPAWNR